MAAIAFFAILGTAAGVLLAIAANEFRKGWEAKLARETKREEQAQALAAARWEVEVKHHGSNTLVKVKRTGSGDPMTIARIAEDSAGYEVELQRARATARQRADLLNSTLDEEE